MKITFSTEPTYTQKEIIGMISSYRQCLSALEKLRIPQSMGNFLEQTAEAQIYLRDLPAMRKAIPEEIRERTGLNYQFNTLEQLCTGLLKKYSEAVDWFYSEDEAAKRALRELRELKKDQLPVSP